MRPIVSPLVVSLCLGSAVLLNTGSPCLAADASKYYHSDSDARYLHHIHLYDQNNRRIGPESTTPYSSANTCGRCHDYESISHGWHFNAFLPDSDDGREAEPWIWTDNRTGTQLPLSYRSWDQTFDPRSVGIDPWKMVKQFGGRIPGGGLGHAPEETTTDDGDASRASSRWPLSGSLEIDCLACHAVSGKYDFNARRDQIAEENFAWAATAALRIGTIKGSVARIKDGSDPTEESTAAKLPKVAYNASAFATDGTIFIDLVRQPQNNACFQCHSNRVVGESGVQPRWEHDQDVHLRAGMQCVDCHRNGIDHHIVRGFPGERYPGGQSMETLSCKGCHLGASGSDAQEGSMTATNRAGRLGSPFPEHAGLPPVHFDKLSCTACHGGPLPREKALGMLTSLAHSLGEKGHRTGSELPRLSGPVYAKRDDGRVYPHRVMWPAYWASLAGDKLEPIDPTRVYDITRKSLRVRKDFANELLSPKLGSKELKELLGEDRYRTKPEERTDDETQQVRHATTEAGKVLFAEKVSAALDALEQELGIQKAVYVSSGFIYGRGDSPDTLEELSLGDEAPIDMVRWPIAHNVRPSGWSLGAGGCTECHSDSGLLFASTVSATGPGAGVGPPTTMASIQGVDPDQRLAWNQLFSGRASFKYVVAGSIASLAAILCFAVGVGLGRIGKNRPISPPGSDSTA